MDAPIYPPASVYVRPAPSSYSFGIDTVTVKEAISTPALNTILIEEAPQMKLILKAAQVQTHISNWSIRSLRTIDLISADALTKIEKRMLALPSSERPAL